jgi:hypothetical protein
LNNPVPVTGFSTVGTTGFLFSDQGSHENDNGNKIDYSDSGTELYLGTGPHNPITDQLDARGLFTR